MAENPAHFDHPLTSAFTRHGVTHPALTAASWDAIALAIFDTMQGGNGYLYRQDSGIVVRIDPATVEVHLRDAEPAVERVIVRDQPHRVYEVAISQGTKNRVSIRQNEDGYGIEVVVANEDIVIGLRMEGDVINQDFTS